MIKREPLSFLADIATDPGYLVGSLLAIGAIYLWNFVQTLWTNFSIFKYFHYSAINSLTMSVAIVILAMLYALLYTLTSILISVGGVTVVRLAWLILTRQRSPKLLRDTSIILAGSAAIYGLGWVISTFILRMLNFTFFVINNTLSTQTMLDWSGNQLDELPAYSIAYLVIMAAIFLVGLAAVALVLRHRRLAAE